MRRLVGALAIMGLFSVGIIATSPLVGAQVSRVITVDPPTVAPGGSFTASGPSDCIEPAPLTVQVAALSLSQAVDGTSAWQAKFTVPLGTAPGQYPVTVTNNECIFTAGTLTVALAESISLVKTVGTAPGVCATTSTLSVPEGTTVYYCYTVTNNTTQTLGVHNLTDDKLGTILTSAAYNLAAGASASTVALGKTVSATATSTVTNTATWTAYTQPGIPFSATASATVTVTTVPAAAAAVTPSFTG